MTEKAIDKPKQNQQFQVSCPHTKVPVLENDSKQFFIPGLSVTWWHCSACDGWHILTTKINPEKDSPGIDPVYQPSSL